MDDEPYGRTEEEIIRRFCREEKVGFEEALIGLARAMVARHVDRELRHTGILPPYPGGDRPEALNALLDALHERRFGDTPEAKTNELLFRMFCICGLLAEQRVEEESRPKMRLVE